MFARTRVGLPCILAISAILTRPWITRFKNYEKQINCIYYADIPSMWRHVHLHCVIRTLECWVDHRKMYPASGETGVDIHHTLCTQLLKSAAPATDYRLYLCNYQTGLVQVYWKYRNIMANQRYRKHYAEIFSKENYNKIWKWSKTSTNVKVNYGLHFHL